MDWLTFPFVDTSSIARDPNAPTFTARTDCPFNWEWIALAFVVGAVLGWVIKK